MVSDVLYVRADLVDLELYGDIRFYNVTFQSNKPVTLTLARVLSPFFIGCKNEERPTRL